MLNRFRRRLDVVVERRVDVRVEDALRDFRHAQEDFEARLGGNQADFSYLRSEFDRLAPQVSALEQRLEWLRVRLAVDELDADDALTRAQAEHERARIRLELAAHYEERLRRLEAGEG